MIMLTLSTLWVSSFSSMPASPTTVEPNTVVSELSPPISASDMQAAVKYLASDALGGRLTGTPGAEKAALLIAEIYESIGLQTIGESDSYFQPFEFSAGVEIDADRTHLKIARPDDNGRSPCSIMQDFVPLTFSGNGEADGEVVFAGYGLVEPETAGQRYDAYEGLDVQNKIVLILRDVPEEVTAQRRQQLSLYAGMRYKAKLAADRGAKAVLLVSGPNSPHNSKPIAFNKNDRTAAVSIPVVSISTELADQLLPKDTSLKKLQTILDGGKLPPHQPTSDGAKVSLAVTLSRKQDTCNNVIGVLPPTGGCDSYIMIGAHYDHIGTGEGLGSLATQKEQGQIHNGADDNASGTAVVLELAAELAAARRNAKADTPQRGVIVACWSGEELGLVGSGHYVNHPLIPLTQIAAYFNFDMVGRLQNNKLILQAVGSSPAWKRMIEKRNVPMGFDLVLQDDPYLPTDATVFYSHDIPILSFFTDLHEDYNRPTDDAETLNYEGMERVARLALLLIKDSLSPKTELPYARLIRKSPEGTRMGLRAYTGVVPDFAAGDITGVKVANVRPEGPAAEAGVHAGDVIVSFAGMDIANLQDYSDALRGAKIGDTAEIIVLRDDQRLTLQITPRARE